MPRYRVNAVRHYEIEIDALDEETARYIAYRRPSTEWDWEGDLEPADSYQIACPQCEAMMDGTCLACGRVA